MNKINLNSDGSKRVHIFIRLGKYFLKRSIIIHTEWLSEVVINAIKPSNMNANRGSSFLIPRKSKKLSVPSSNALKEMIISCRSSSVLEAFTDSSASSNMSLDEKSNISASADSSTGSNMSLDKKSNISTPSRAMIILKTYSHNEPVFRIC